MILAATIQQGIGVALIVTVVTGVLMYMIVENRVTPQNNVDSFLNAPNRKAAPDDDVFEGPRLDRFLSWALIAMTLVAISLPLYWLGEVGRQEGAIRGFDKRQVHRGEQAYYNSPNSKHGTPALNCAKCHGENAGGGAVSFTTKDLSENGEPMKDAKGKDLVRSVQWAAPRINDVALRYRRDQLYNVLVYGRAGSPMAAWGVAGGGGSTDQTIYDLIAYLRHLALEKNPAAREIYEEHWDKTQDAEASFEKALDSEFSRTMRQEETTELLAAAKKVKTNVGKSDGEILYEMNCARCHTAGWSVGEAGKAGSGGMGPRLTTESLKTRFPLAKDQAAFIKQGTDAANKEYGVRGINGWEGGGMPYFQNVLTDAQIDAIVEYERGLGHSEDTQAEEATQAVAQTETQK
jgi:mono/diheme cytochrome c family protein